MESDIENKKKYTKIIWSLDNIPKFIIIQFNPKKLSQIYTLSIDWNRPVKGYENNLITIKISYSGIFFEEKKVSIDRFKMESCELVRDVHNKLNNTILIQGLTIDNYDKNIQKKVLKYNKYVLKYIDKKINKTKTIKIVGLKKIIAT
jgi:hypothetical protein